MLPPRRTARLAVRAFPLNLALAAIGSGGGAERTTASTGSPGPTAGVPSVASPTSTASPAVARSSPRWETVATFKGWGPTETAEFAIVPNAMQWRVRWSCEPGTLRISTTPPPRRPVPLAQSACPASGHGFAIHTGAIRLGAETDGGWSAVVDQQVDTPLDEAPLAGAASARVVAEGRFHDVEKPGTGSVRLYRLGDGRPAVRFEGFHTAMSRLWGGIHWRGDSEAGLVMGGRIGELFVERARADGA